MLVASGRGWAEVLGRAETGLHATVEAIRNIGLRASLPKTEACEFQRPRNPRPREILLSVDDVRIGLKGTLKYLGLVFDSGFCFGKHLAHLGPKIRAVSATLERLMQNLRGPQARARRLFATVVHSVALYGAPV